MPWRWPNPGSGKREGSQRAFPMSRSGLGWVLTIDLLDRSEDETVSNAVGE